MGILIGIIILGIVLWTFDSPATLPELLLKGVALVVALGIIYFVFTGLGAGVDYVNSTSNDVDDNVFATIVLIIFVIVSGYFLVDSTK